MHPSRLAAQSTDHANEVPTSEYMEHSRYSLTSANMDVYHEPRAACAPRGPLKGAANALDHTLEVPSQTSFCRTMLCKRCLLCRHAATFVNSVKTSNVIIILFTVK